MMQFKSKTSAGFTLIELMIGVVVMGILLFLVDRIYLDTTNAVSRGIAVSDIIANSRAINDQLHRDAKDMQGPNSSENGVLFIGNFRINGVPLRVPSSTTNVRSDQLVFIVNASKLEAMTPDGPGGFGGIATVSATRPVARVWYGHVRVTQPSGIPMTVGGSFDDLGKAGGLNHIAKDWILGRQALLFQDDSTGSSAHAYSTTSGFGTAPSYMPRAPVVGYTGGGLPTLELYMGLTDVAYASYDNASSDAYTVRNRLIIGGTATTSLLTINTTDATYRNRVSQHLSYSTERLFANPAPTYKTVDPFKSWQIAQMHPVFMKQISDFVVEFAGDISTGGTSGTVTMDPATGGSSIYWADGYKTPPIASLPGGWTSYIPYSEQNMAAAKYTFVWRHDTPARWPQLIRVRYRLHDSRGLLMGPRDVSTAPTEDDYGRWFETIIKVKRN